MEGSDIISGISLFVSIGAVVFAKKSSSKANEISTENLKLQSGMVELEVSQSIENSKARVVDITTIMAPLASKKEAGTINNEDQLTLDSYVKNFDATVQTLMNTYDVACSKYIDGKVDKTRFKKSYKYEIRNLLEDQSFKEYFDPLTSRYKSILSVFDEWDNDD
ncbi:hypothetical protein [Vibrio sp. 1F279]|uniref:hypothetical protein n=1 Tax=unclassified Vibrio TaxID=2614977 RepID=UPI00352C9416